jgi:hypothetical protein
MSNSEQFEEKGLQLLKEGGDRQALEYFITAVRLNHLNYNALQLLLNTAHQLGLTQDALKTLHDLLKEHPADRIMFNVAQEFVNKVRRKSGSLENLTTLIMSKDRPLQLQGCLESLFYHSEIEPRNITILYKESGNIYYDLLIEKYPTIRWVREKQFNEDIQLVLNESQDYLFLCCDDVIFTELFNFHECLKALEEDADLFNFTMRLGKNILPLPNELTDTGNFLKWKWYNPDAVRWYYPWSVSVSLYRKEEVLSLIRPFLGSIINPNFFESTVAQYLQAYPHAVPAYLASFHHSKCVATQVNRVQDTHCNKFDSCKNTDIDGLYRAFLQGYAVDWERIKGIDNPDFNMGAEYFELKINEPAGRAGQRYESIMDLLPFDNPYENFMPTTFPKTLDRTKEFNSLDAQITETNPRMIVLVGTGRGDLAVQIGAFLRSGSNDGLVFCIDTWLGTGRDMIGENGHKEDLRRYYRNGYPFFYYQFLADIVHCGLENYIIPFANTGRIGAEWLNHHNIQADLVYFNESEEEPYGNLLDFWPVLRPGGMMAGHERLGDRSNLMRDAQKFAEEKNLNLEIIESGWILKNQ